MQKLNVSLVSAGYPPDLDGIGDYSFFLARALAERAKVARPVHVYTRKGKHEHADGVRFIPFYESARPLSIGGICPLLLRDKPDWLLLQYNPFGWGRRGFCPAVPKTLQSIRKLPQAPKSGSCSTSCLLRTLAGRIG